VSIDVKRRHGQSEKRRAKKMGNSEQKKEQIKKEFEVEKEEEHYKYIVEADVDEYYVHRLVLTRRFYPYGRQYDNYFDVVLEVINDRNAGKIVMRMYTVRYSSRDGVVRTDRGWIAVDVPTTEIWFFYRGTIERMASASDFEKFVKSIIEFVIDYVNEMNILTF